MARKLFLNLLEAKRMIFLALVLKNLPMFALLEAFRAFRVQS